MSYTRPKLISNEINSLSTKYHDAECILRSWNDLLQRSIAPFRIVEWGFPDVKGPGRWRSRRAIPARLILRKCGPLRAD
jgi:hypothetical protein